MTFEVCSQIGGMTVAEMRERMSGAEFTRWIAFLSERNRREQQSYKQAQRRARR